MCTSALPEGIYVAVLSLTSIDIKRECWVLWNWSCGMDGRELPRGCWDWYPGPLQEQQVPLTTEPPSRHASCLIFLRLALSVLEAGLGLSILLPQGRQR